MRMKKIYLVRLGNRVRLIFILFACGQVGQQQQQEVTQAGEGRRRGALSVADTFAQISANCI